MIRFYLMPIGRTTNPATGVESRYVMYALPGVRWAAYEYGVTDVYLYAVDVTPEQHAELVAHSDVTAFPENLDVALGGARQQWDAALEAQSMPGSWITASQTYREVLRVVAGSCQIAKEYARLARLAGANPSLFPPEVTLNTTYANMPVAYRDRLYAAIDALGYDRSALTAQSSMRTILQQIGQQATPAPLLGVVI